MTRRELVLATMATVGGERFQPVHVQKLFFLIDQRLAAELDGPFFDFQPYDYGPFDQAVYSELDGLKEQGLIEIDRRDLVRAFSLTDSGLEAGRKALETIGTTLKEKLRELTVFVVNLGFRQLVSVIYRDYPEMRENSVFAG